MKMVQNNEGYRYNTVTTILLKCILNRIGISSILRGYRGFCSLSQMPTLHLLYSLDTITVNNTTLLL